MRTDEQKKQLARDVAEGQRLLQQEAMDNYCEKIRIIGGKE